MFLKLSEYSNLKNEYAYLCPDETLQLISDNSKPPCAWLRQPWPVIISNALVIEPFLFINLHNFLMQICNKQQITKVFNIKLINFTQKYFSGDSIPLKEGINRWIYGVSGWEGAIKDIIAADNLTPVITTIQRPRDIFFPCTES